MSKPWEHAKSSGSEADPIAARFVASIDYDQRLYRHDILGSRAHACMLQAQGLITAEDLTAILGGLDAIEAEIEAQGTSWPGWQVELEDVHMCVEAALIEKIGEPGRKLHTGRSRNDQVALDLRLWTREAEGVLQEKTFAVVSALVDLATREGKAPLPSYTHLQRAQPIVVGGEVLAWAEALDRCAYRAHLLCGPEGPDTMENPLGSGAIGGSSLPLDRDATTDALGFGAPTRNSLDATASRDAALDMAYSCAMYAQWLSRWAEQWIIYMTCEFGFLQIGDAYTTGSSMMPQKRNPDMLELVRGKSGQAYGSLMALLTMTKGITIGYNRDLQEDKKHLFQSFDAICDCLDVARGIIRTASFNTDHIAAGLSGGHLDATSLAEHLTGLGIPFRTAHQITGQLVKQADAQGTDLRGLPLDAFNAACETAGHGTPCTDDLFTCLGPEGVVQRYQSSGNSGLSGFEEQLKNWQERLAEI